MSSKFLLNPWLNLAQKPVCSALLSKHTWVCADERTARENSREKLVVHFDLRADETLGSRSGAGETQPILAPNPQENTQTDYLISHASVALSPGWEMKGILMIKPGGKVCWSSNSSETTQIRVQVWRFDTQLFMLWY